MGYSTKIMVRRRRVLVLGQLGVLKVPNATVHLLVSSVCLVFVSVLSSLCLCLSCLRSWSADRRTIIRRRRTKSKRLLT